MPADPSQSRPLGTSRKFNFIKLAGLFVCMGAAVVFSDDLKEVWKSEIASYESVQKNKDYRISLLGVTKGLAFVDSQELISDGGRTPGKNAVPWMRIDAVIENLNDKDEPMRFSALSPDGKEFVGKIRIESNGRVTSSRIRGDAEVDVSFPALHAATFPVGLPTSSHPTNTKVHSFTLSGSFQYSKTIDLNFSLGNVNPQSTLVFKGVPLP